MYVGIVSLRFTSVVHGDIACESGVAREARFRLVEGQYGTCGVLV